MDSKNKFWRGVMVGVLVTALVCLITVGASAGIYMFGRRVIDNQTQVQVQTEGTPSQAQEPVNFENVTKKLEQIQDIIDKKYLFEEKIDTSEEEAGIYQGFLSGLNDPYAVYYTPDELTSFLDETNGCLRGIGARYPRMSRPASARSCASLRAARPRRQASFRVMRFIR